MRSTLVSVSAGASCGAPDPLKGVPWYNGGNPNATRLLAGGPTQFNSVVAPILALSGNVTGIGGLGRQT